MSESRSLNIPVILGTSRKGRASVHAANLIADLLNRRAGVRSAVIDIASVPLPVDDAGEAIKSTAFSAAIAAADGLVIVAPELPQRVHPQGRRPGRRVGRSVCRHPRRAEPASGHA